MRSIKSVLIASCVAVALLTCVPAHAESDCWLISNVKGYSATADMGYKFFPDGISGTTMICFTSDGGFVTGNDIRLVKFGSSTLAGYGGNDRGYEIIVVYQLDRKNRKLSYVKTRIGTETIAPILPDIVSAFVGDAAPARR